MSFLVQYRLVKVGMLQRWGMLNWNSSVSFSAAGRSWCYATYEWGKQVSVSIEWQIAVHHALKPMAPMVLSGYCTSQKPRC